MPEKKTLERAKEQRRKGNSPSTQAGEFIREEMHHIKEGKHGARSRKQAIAIGLSKARRAGVDLAPPEKGKAKKSTRKQAKRDLAKGKSPSARRRRPSPTRSRASKKALKREGRPKLTTKRTARRGGTTKRTRTSPKRTTRKTKRTRTRA